MDEVDSLIRSFKAQPKDEESGEKIDAILELEEIEDERVMPFFLEVISDEEEYDLARIEVLKILKLRKSASPEEHNRVGETIKRVLLEDPDPDVRNYAAMAMSNYLDVEGGTEAVARVLHSPAENENLRHNALFAIERGGPTEQNREIVMKLLADEKFSKHAARVLKDWEEERK